MSFFAQRMQRYAHDSAFSLVTLLKWLAIATLVGGIVGAVGATFGRVLILVNDIRAAHPRIILGLPLAGMAIVFLYRFFHNTEDRGTNTVIRSVRTPDGVPTRMAPLIFVSTVLTHLFGGSAGREGAAIQLGGSIASRIGKMLRLSENDRHLIVMCGMSAGFSALFGTPLAAALFSLEVVSVGIMHYSALVPCVTASMIGHFVAELMQMPPEVFPVSAVPAISPVSFFLTVIFAALLGAVSIVFCIILHEAEHLFHKYIRNPYLRIASSACAILLLCALLRTDEYLGSGMGIIEGVFHSRRVAPFAFLLKMLFTALTLGAGFKGGEIVPSFCIGASFGAVAGALFGLPMELASACGMAGVFCGVTNCPITALLISFELFGFEGMPYYLTTVAVSYMLSGYYGLYHAQKIVYSKTETHFIDAKTH